MKRTRILIADDHPVFREGIRNLLKGEDDMEVIAEASDGEETIKLSTELKPDIVVMDIIMPKINGIETAKHIKAALPTTAILMLSAYSYESYVLAALQAGAAGFLSKTAHSDELINAIRTVRIGEPVLDQTIAYKILNRLVSTTDSKSGAIIDQLHSRETEVLKLAAKGMTNKEIAQELAISERTVQTHFANIFRKLNVGSRIEAVLFALREGWFSWEELQ